MPTDSQKSDFLTSDESENIRNCLLQNGLDPSELIFDVIECHGVREDNRFMRKGIIRLRYNGAPTALQYTISEASSHMCYILNDITSGKFIEPQ